MPLDAAGRYTFTYTPLDGDTTPHGFRAEYHPSGSFKYSEVPFYQDVIKRAADIEMSLSPTTAYVLQPVTIAIHVEDDTTAGTPAIPQGTMTFDDGGKNGTFSNDTPTLNVNGNCTVTYTPGAGDEGATTITAIYSGSSVHTPKSTNQLLTVELRPTKITVEGPTAALLVYEPGDIEVQVEDGAGGDGPAPDGTMTVELLLLPGDGEITNLTGPNKSDPTSTWSFDYMCTGLDLHGDYEALGIKYEPNDGIYAESGIIFVQALMRRPTETTLTDCTCTLTGVLCTVTVEDHPDNDGKGNPADPQGDFVAEVDEDGDGVFDDKIVGSATTEIFPLTNDLPMMNVTVRYEPSDRIYLESVASENVDRKDCMPAPGPGDGTTGANCTDGCGSGGTDITGLLYDLRNSVSGLQAVSLAWSLKEILTRPSPVPIWGVGGGAIVVTVTGSTIPTKGIKAFIIGLVKWGIDVYIYTVTRDADGDGLPDVVEQNTTDTEFTEKDSDGDGMTDSLEIAVAGGYYGGSRRPNPHDSPDSDGDGLKDGEEWYTYDTNPCVADTDCDLLSDGDEVATWSEGDVRLHVDPLKQDTDGDGISDYIEYHVTNSPCPFGNDPDSDGDGLIDGYEDKNLDGCWGASTGGTLPGDPGYCGSDEITVGDSTTQAYKVSGHWETNLCDPDTDDDGLSDGEEEGLFGTGAFLPEGVSTVVGLV
jgi:hypothetical protein